MLHMPTNMCTVGGHIYGPTCEWYVTNGNMCDHPSSYIQIWLPYPSQIPYHSLLSISLLSDSAFYIESSNTCCLYLPMRFTKSGHCEEVHHKPNAEYMCVLTKIKGHFKWPILFLSFLSLFPDSQQQTKHFGITLYINLWPQDQTVN